jgi:hypothetical protein
MNGFSRAFRPVIEQRQLATLKHLRTTAAELTVRLKDMQAAGLHVEPGPLNFMRGKVLLHSPVPEPVQAAHQLASFQLLVKLISQDDADVLRGQETVGVAWRERRTALFAGMLADYRSDVLDIHSELAKRGRLTPTATLMDRASLYLWLGEMRLAGYAFSLGATFSARLAGSAARNIVDKLVQRGLAPQEPVTA